MNLMEKYLRKVEQSGTQKTAGVYCYWLNSDVDGCDMPCFEIEAMKVIHECPHFRAHWRKHIKKL
jgi:hypothetical protein